MYTLKSIVFSLYENKVLQSMSVGACFERIGKNKAKQANLSETSPFLSAQMAVPSSLLQLFIVLGIYNLDRFLNSDRQNPPTSSTRAK